MEVTNENYFSREVALRYFSNSQIHDFVGTPMHKGCEANAMHRIENRDIASENKTTALLVGGYVDAYFEGSLDEFRRKNPSIFKVNGDLKADYKRANEIIEFAKLDPFFMKYMNGQTQVILKGDIFGHPFIGKLDVLHEKAIVDGKVMKGIDKEWIKGQGKMNFIDAYGYPDQLSIYQELERQRTGIQKPVYLAVLTKEPVPYKGIISIPQWRLDDSMNLLKEVGLDRLQSIKNGEIEPTRCEECDYCKSTKKIETVISYEDFL